MCLEERALWHGWTAGLTVGLGLCKDEEKLAMKI